MSESYTITGTIKQIGETQTFTSGFTKREFVIETDDPKWAQQIKFDVVKDKCQELDALNQGDYITVNFNIRGNEYNGKYYVNLQAWKLDQVAGHQQQQVPIHSYQQPQPQEPVTNFEQQDDIPF